MKKILLHITSGEVNFLPSLKPLLSGRASISVNASRPVAVEEIVMIAAEKGTKLVATTCPKLLQLLLKRQGEKLPSLDDYAGSIIHYKDYSFLILPPLAQIHTVNHGKFLLQHYMNKFISPESWPSVPSFTWSIYSGENEAEILDFFSSSFLISCDIETLKEPLAISCIGLTAVRRIEMVGATAASIEQRTVVFPATSLATLAFVQRLLHLPQPKVLQNGKYDITYLLRYGITIYNYALDTINLFHCWYAELPKSLDSIASFCIHDWLYWKDEAKNAITDEEYFRYNAKDAFITVFAALYLIEKMPPWALKNYGLEFPIVFPCILAEGTGIKLDLKQMAVLETQLEEVSEASLAGLRKMVACKNFNPRSPKQTLALLSALGSSDLTSSNKASMDKAKSRHPLNKRILGAIESYRQDMKLLSSYIKPEAAFNSRCLYSLNPHGTDTSRLASKESALWCGMQIQNIPRDRTDVQIKSMFVADEGFFLGESDGEQAETRHTAYLSGDTALIAAVEGDKDFHSWNASLFFGVPYEKIFDDATGKQLDKPLRDLSKRTNHGANYNMGPDVMLETMGIEKTTLAKKLLGLPSAWPLRKVTDHLLTQFAATYKILKGPWYDKIRNDVTTSKLLVGPQGWTRYCFGRPDKNKLDMNAYAAHPPQSSSAQMLNAGFLKVFKDIWLVEGQVNFKLHAQIHDSILFSYRKDRADLPFKVKSCMEIETPVRDTFGITRTLLVPAACSGEGLSWSELKKLKQPKGD